MLADEFASAAHTFYPPSTHLLPTFYPPSTHLLPTFYPPSTHLLPPKQCRPDSQSTSLQDVLNEVERNLHDAMGVARNVALDPRLVPGGGAVEMAVARGLNDKASTVGRQFHRTHHD